MQEIVGFIVDYLRAIHFKPEGDIPWLDAREEVIENVEEALAGDEYGLTREFIHTILHRFFIEEIDWEFVIYLLSKPEVN